MAKEAKQKEIQEKLLMYQLLKSNMEQLVQRSNALEKRYIELESTKQTINDLSSLKEGNEILVPLGSGCYAEGKVTASKKILIDIGAGVTVFKEPDKIKKDIDSKIKEIEESGKQLQEQMNQSMAKMNEIQPEIQRMMQG